MGFSVGIHPPKTPITKGSGGVAKATIPNVCKIPGPPAPFVPSPLPNIAKSEMSPDGYSTSVKIEGNAVAIRGATFASMGDEASKGTGGGLISANTQGPVKFITPGSMTVMIEGKNVHLKGDPVLNNCAAGGSPPNTGATMAGTDNPDAGGDNPVIVNCDKGKPNKPNLSKCEKEELCAKGRDMNEQLKNKDKNGVRRITGDEKEELDAIRRSHLGKLNRAAQRGQPAKLQGFTCVTEECRKEMEDKANQSNYKGFSPDHILDMGLGGHPTSDENLRWMSSDMNSWIGSITGKLDPEVHTGVDVSTCCK